MKTFLACYFAVCFVSAVIVTAVAWKDRHNITEE